MRALLTGDDPAVAERLPRWQRLALDGARRTGAMSPARIRTLSRKWMPIGKRVVVVGGGLVGVEIAEFLAERGRRVTVLEEGPYAATEMAHPRRWRALHNAREHGVRILVSSRLTEIRSDSVMYEAQDATSGRARRMTITADHVIIASGVSADRSLAERLTEFDIEAEVIGDAAEVTYIEGAIRTGYDLGVTL